MSGFASWGLTVLGLAVVMTVAEMLLPGGRIKKTVRAVFATVTALVIITPIPALLKTGSISGIFTGEAVETDGAYIDYVEGAKSDIFAAAAQNYLEQKGIEGVTVRVAVGADFTVKSVRLEFCNSGITQNGEHINKSEIVRLIAEYFDIGKEAVMTYG